MTLSQKLLAAVLIFPGLASAAENSAYLFTSFMGNGDGLHLSYSKDALHWTAIDKVFLKPNVGSKLMRDSQLMQGPDGVFHLVWTTGWKDTGIGHATSKDLVNWSEQDYFPFMEKIPGTKNCWAPETFYDAKGDQYMISWSSDVEGRFDQTKSPDRMNNRTYYVTTKDFKSFSEPAILLDPGFDHIDATILPFQGKYTMVFKEGDRQGKGKAGPVHAAIADSPLGPYKVLPQPLVTERAEGPALVNVGGKILLYVDFYANGHYGVHESSDWKKWTDISSQASVVEGQRHGTILPVSNGILKSLVPDAGTPAPPAALPGLTADPHIAAFGDTFYIYPTTDGTEGWMSTLFHGWSSKDLKHWKDEGVVLDLPHDLKWADIRAWAPAIATKNGKYYYYFSAGQSIGVAVSDHPMGPFKDALGKPLVAKAEYPCQSIDPMVFVDDDGAAYLYFGQGKCMAVKLNDDMISFDHAAAKPIQPSGYNEGSFVFKRKSVYYLSWSEFDTRDPRYSVAYATSDSPLGPYQKVAGNPILKQKGEVKGAGHHSIMQIPGRDEWVIAYHRFHIPGGNGYNRKPAFRPCVSMTRARSCRSMFLNPCLMI